MFLVIPVVPVTGFNMCVIQQDSSVPFLFFNIYRVWLRFTTYWFEWNTYMTCNLIRSPSLRDSFNLALNISFNTRFSSFVTLVDIIPLIANACNHAVTQAAHVYIHLFNRYYRSQQILEGITKHGYSDMPINWRKNVGPSVLSD